MTLIKIFLLWSAIFAANSAFAMSKKNRPPTAPSGTVAFPAGGGSNMVFLDLGQYPADNSKWSDVKTTLIHYDKYRTQAQNRLIKMRAEGQSRLSVMLWYVEEGLKCQTINHVVCPQKGILPTQVQSNIKNLLQDMKAAKYETLVFRFATQSKADPLQDGYDVKRIKDSWKLISETIKLTEAAAKGTGVNVLYDLGVETMGHPYSNKPAAMQFLSNIWNAYTSTFPLEKTVGFSFNHAHEKAVTNSLSIYQNSGKWPNIIAIDIYHDPDTQSENLNDALGKFGRNWQPVIVTETYYNNAEMANAFRKNKRKVNFQYVLQWPLTPGASGHANLNETPSIGNYYDKNLFALDVRSGTKPPRPTTTRRPLVLRRPFLDRDFKGGKYLNYSF